MTDCWSKPKLFALLTLVALSLAAPERLLAVEPPEKSTKQAEPPAKKQAEDEQAKKEKEIADLLAVPAGNAEDLIKFIVKIQTARPPVTTQQEFNAYRRKAAEAMSIAAEKTLTLDPTEKQAVTAITTKFLVLQMMRDWDKTAEDQWVKLADSLKDDQRPAVASVAKRNLLTFRARKWEKDAPAAKRDAFLADLKAFFKDGEVTREQVSFGMQVCQALENSGDLGATTAAYQALGALFSSSADPVLASYGAKMEGVARRLNLVGQGMELDGTLLDGSAFDWASYKGKVVLVDFWATWCGPCVAEIPHVLENYERYHDKGFEVVGISLDTSKEKVSAFIAERKIPWATLYAEGDNPLAVKYGIMSIPTAILIDQNGQVLTLNARGPELSRQLQELLGDPKETQAKDAKPIAK